MPPHEKCERLKLKVFNRLYNELCVIAAVGRWSVAYIAVVGFFIFLRSTYVKAKFRQSPHDPCFAGKVLHSSYCNKYNLRLCERKL